MTLFVLLIVSKKLSVRQTESLVKALKSAHKSKNTFKDPNILELENNLRNKIGINVLIKNNRNNAGRITFEYKDLDQLNRILTVLKTSY